MKDRNKSAIGIFDSGMGGLTVLHSIMEALPYENLVYLGDTARVPYGTKSARTVTQYSLEIASFLVDVNIKALVVACNTASAVALPFLREKHSLPVIGMIEAAAKKAVQTTKNGHIGVIGTEGTVRSGAYEKAINALGGDFSTVSNPCPLFVPLAEEGWVDNEIALLTAEKYLSKFKKNQVDTLILGCTHFPLFKETIKKVMEDKVTLIDSGEEAAIELKTLLQKSGDNVTNGEPQRRYYVTDAPERFRKLGARFLSEKIGEVLHVEQELVLTSTSAFSKDQKVFL